jgi:hypothetical protein
MKISQFPNKIIVVWSFSENVNPPRVVGAAGDETLFFFRTLTFHLKVEFATVFGLLCLT